MADILPQEEIDALLDIVDSETVLTERELEQANRFNRIENEINDIFNTDYERIVMSSNRINELLDTPEDLIRSYEDYRSDYLNNGIRYKSSRYRDEERERINKFNRIEKEIEKEIEKNRIIVLRNEDLSKKNSELQEKIKELQKAMLVLAKEKPTITFA